MKSTGLTLKEFDAWATQAILNVTPGFKVVALHKGQRVFQYQVGETFQIYDLASLTKIIFTTTVLMKLVSLKKIDLEADISSILDKWPKSRMKIKSLLNHSSGLLWWSAFYEKVIHVDSFSERHDLLVNELKKQIAAVDEKMIGMKSVYSDIGFLILGELIQKVTGSSLNENLISLIQDEILSDGIHFCQNNVPVQSVEKYAPTQKEMQIELGKNYLRTHLIQGEVNDENTWALGGVASHAGLFGSIEDLECYFLKVRKILLGLEVSSANSVMSSKVVKHFFERSVPPAIGDWALGFMMPTLGSSSSGQFFSKDSVGHTGFTGTSLWFDPIQDLSIIILSNRTYISKESKEFAKLRPLIHDQVVRHLNFQGVLS